MIEQGTLKDSSAAELLLKGYAEELTGVLYLKRDEILKELYMKEGKFVWAVSNSDVDMIENVLVSENKVDAQTINLLKGESKNKVDLGKALVEKGVLSFEEFVGYSKEQLDKILTSVLKWSDGVYYFSNDVPAEAYISLDINLKDYIFSFIREKLDMGFVWTRIGSLQEELMQTHDQGLIEKFDLTKEELELFDKFIGDLSIEMISLDFPEMAKEDILKTIYFFIIAGLLIEKSDNPIESIDKSVLVSDTDNRPNDNLVDEDIFNESIDSIDFDKSSDVKEFSALEGISENERGYDDLNFISEEEIFSEEKGISLSEQLLSEMDKEDKKKGKLINIVLLLVLALFIISGLIFVLLQPKKNDKPNPSINDKSDVIEISEKDVKNKKEIKTKIKPVIKSSNKKKESKQIEDSNNKISKTIVNTEISINPFDKFNQGKLKESGELWRKKILTHNKRFSILLEMDCMNVSVKNAFKNTNKSEIFFILNIYRNEKQCYLVLFGIFKDKQAAESSLNSVPEYFWSQPNPPKVIDLKEYL